jgi:ring-1,2-phenylacetyl-CoA epoxidase subunit PaaB
MPDTQWPRFVVFQRDKPGEPYYLAGSVHAPDAEMALLNARDVFARRPECAGLWVVPTDRVFSLTAEEIAAHPDWADSVNPAAGAVETYYVFVKPDHRRPHTYAGEVEAASAEGAMQAALARIAGSGAVVCWVMPKRLITASTPDDIAPMFEPARGKLFRDQGQYHTVAFIQRRRHQADDEG